MSTPQTIPTLIIENFDASRKFLAGFLDINPNDGRELAPFVKILAALRALPQEALDDLALPILATQFDRLGLNPKNGEDRKVAAEMVDIFALAIQDATAMAMQAMQNQQEAANALRKGRGNLLQV